jgi:hypothetical protein
MILILIAGLTVVMVGSFVLAYFLSRHKAPRPALFTDKDFQIWAFGHVLEKDASLSDIPGSWNLHHFDHQINLDHSIKSSIEYMLKRYDKERGIKN